MTCEPRIVTVHGSTPQINIGERLTIAPHGHLVCGLKPILQRSALQRLALQRSALRRSALQRLALRRSALQKLTKSFTAFINASFTDPHSQLNNTLPDQRHLISMF